MADSTPTHLLCHLPQDHYRAWLKRSLSADVCVANRVRPQAYSSSSARFRALLEDAQREERKLVLWIVTPVERPGQSRPRSSLAAEIHISRVVRGDEAMSAHLRRYVQTWSDSDGPNPSEFSVAQADLDRSRLYASNDIGACLAGLRDVEGAPLASDAFPAPVLRIHPADVARLKSAAEDVARNTLFISYKHCDFELPPDPRRPEWEPDELAEVLIERGLGVWLDTLASPVRPVPGQGSDEVGSLTQEELRRLLTEGHSQSGAVVAIHTERYLTPGEGRSNWTGNEYTGRLSEQTRSSALRRFVLHGAAKPRLHPPPDRLMNWSTEIRGALLRELRSLLATPAHFTSRESRVRSTGAV